LRAICNLREQRTTMKESDDELHNLRYTSGIRAALLPELRRPSRARVQRRCADDRAAARRCRAAANGAAALPVTICCPATILHPTALRAAFRTAAIHLYDDLSAQQRRGHREPDLR